MLKIIKRVFSPLFLHQSASFEFDGTINDAVHLLSINVKRRQWFFTFEELLLGKVSNSGVSIWHYCPLRIGYTVIVFYGKFTSTGGKTILTGTFMLHKLQKVFYILILIIFMMLSGTIAVRQISSNILSSLLVLFSPLIIMPILLQIGSFAKEDIKSIENRLTEILQHR
jgi:hypothetical protein